MKVDFSKMFLKNLEKIMKASGESNFSLCTKLSTDLLRASDYVDFDNGVFIGEFFESLFGNLTHLNGNYQLEKETLDDLNNKVTNLVLNIKGSFPFTEKKKSELYDLMKELRAKATKLQLESMRGEIKMKKGRRALPTEVAKIIGEIDKEFE